MWDWYADEKGVVRAGIANDGFRWTIWYRDKPDEKLRTIRGKVDRDADSAVDRFIFRGPKAWIVTNERTGRFGLYEYDLTKAAIGKAIYEHPSFDIDDVYFDPFTGEVKVIEYEDDRRRFVWQDADTRALQAKVDKAIPSNSNAMTSWSQDDNRVLVWSEGADDPGRYYLLDRKSGQMHAVVAPYPEIEPDRLAPTKWVDFTARDGLALHGYLTLPKGMPAKGLPLVMMPHGGPYMRDHWEYDPTVQFLASRGYAVFQPQFRGSVGRGKDFVAKGFGQWGRKMQDDLDDGVKWLVQSGQIDPRRVCIVGASYGGYAAMWAAVRNPETYRCAASFAGVSDLSAMLDYDKQFFAATRYFQNWREKVRGESSVDLRGVSPLTYANKIKIPVLIGHGEDDDNVPVSQSRKMVEALEQSGANVTGVFYKDEGHGFNKKEDLTDWLKRLEAFLSAHNAP